MGLVNTDGAYAGFVAHQLLAGARPAPVFTEGANYQGTLKGHLAARVGAGRGVDDLSLGRGLRAASSPWSSSWRAWRSPAASADGRPRSSAASTSRWVPKFLTVFTLNAWASTRTSWPWAVLLSPSWPRSWRARASRADRLYLLALGALLGAAFWQQPVAVVYVVACAMALAAWRPERERPARAWTVAGLAIGVLPVLLWNARHAWSSAQILGRDPADVAAHLDVLPVLVSRTFMLSFPVLAGASRGHPWWGEPLRWFGVALIPAALLAFLAVRGRALAVAVSRRIPAGATLPPLLVVVTLAVFWSSAAGNVYFRPRYLLPLMGATAVHLGVVLAAVPRRARPLALLALGGLLAVNVAGTLDRLGDGAATEDYYRRVVRSLEKKGVRTGFADFSLSAPVTMFTHERVLLSSRLGPTPAYEPDEHLERVVREGPDAYVLRPDDDPRQFEAALRRLGVSWRLDLDPVPVFYGFSRRVRLEEVAGFRGEGAVTSAPDEE